MSLSNEDIGRIIHRVVDHGLDTGYVAGQFDISRRRVQQLVKTFKDTGLHPVVRRRGRSPHSDHPPDLVDRVLRIRRKTKRGAVAIARHLRIRDGIRVGNDVVHGIPSEELRDWDWVELAAALATGEKKMTPDGRETTEIDGRWYFSDSNDTGSFLKEHGAKPKEKKKSAVRMDKTELLAKLEERFILGEISEETYNKLREKYEVEDE